MTGEREMCVNGRKSAVRDQLFRTVVVVNVSGAVDRQTDGRTGTGLATCKPRTIAGRFLWRKRMESRQSDLERRAKLNFLREGSP